MSRLLVALGVGLAVTACGGGSKTLTCPAGATVQDGRCVPMAPAAPQDEPEPGAVRDMRVLADRSCACKDVTCLKPVTTELDELSARIDRMEPSEHTAIRGVLQEHRERAGVCAARLELERVPANLRTAVAECDELTAAWLSCDKMPKQALEAFLEAAANWKNAVDTDPSVRNPLRESCAQATQAALAAFRAVGCEDAGQRLRSQ